MLLKYKYNREKYILEKIILKLEQLKKEFSNILEQKRQNQEILKYINYDQIKFTYEELKQFKIKINNINNSTEEEQQQLDNRNQELINKNQLLDQKTKEIESLNYKLEKLQIINSPILQNTLKKIEGLKLIKVEVQNKLDNIQEEVNLFRENL